MQENKLLQKLLAMMLIFTLTFANFALVTKSYAASFTETFFGTTSDTGHKNVEFEAFFDQEGWKQKMVVSDVNNQSLAIKLNLNVLNAGYLKDARVEILEAEEGKGLNFEIGKNGVSESSETTKAEQIEQEQPEAEPIESESAGTEISVPETTEPVENETLPENTESNTEQDRLEEKGTQNNETETNELEEKSEEKSNDETSNSNMTFETGTVVANLDSGVIGIEEIGNEEILDEEKTEMSEESTEKTEEQIGENAEEKQVDESLEKSEESQTSEAFDEKNLDEQEETNEIEESKEVNEENKPEENSENNEIEENSENIEDIDEKNEEVSNTSKEIEFPEYVESLEDNVLTFNQINSVSNIDIAIPIKYKNEAYVNKNVVSNNCIVRLTAIYIDGEGKENEIQKDEILTVNWSDNRDLEVETGTTKYIDFGSGIILQTIIRTDSIEEGNRLPIEKSELDVEVPVLAGRTPSNVLVVANSLEGTNGEKAGNLNFNENNWTYNEVENKIQIEVENNEKLVKESEYNDEYLKDGEETEEQRVYNSNGIDEYLITYTYPELSIEDAEDTMVSSIDAKLTMIGGEEITNNNTYQYGLGESQGDIVSLKTDTNIEEISKAYSYINYNNENKYEIEVETSTLINVSYKDIVKGLIVEDLSNVYVNKEAQESETEDIYYKKIEISKENFNKMLGEEGQILVKDKDGNILKDADGNDIGIINKETTVNEEGNIELNIIGKYTKLIYETSAPIAEGNIIINAVRAIGNLSIDKQTLINMSEIKTKQVLKANYEYVEETVEVEQKEVKVKLTDTQTEAKLKIDRESLSTLSLNENVEMRIELNNASEKSDIYGHSVFEIEVPEYIESLNITNTNILFGEGLSISNMEVDGNIIRVTVDGKQEAINTGILTNGTNIVLNADIKVNLYTPSKKEQIKLKYTNDESTNYANNGEDAINITYSAPTGLVAVNSISGFKDDGSIVQSVRQGKKNGILDIYASSRVVTEELVVMNNNGNNISNISILGRFPFEGVKDILTGDSLGTTLNTRLVTGIAADARNGVEFKVYYTENAEADSNLENSSNGWIENPENIENMKSYLIIPSDENYEMEDAKLIRFTYQYEIPENLNHNEYFYGTFMVNYTNESEILLSEEREIADLVGLTTGEGPELEVELIPNKEEVKEYEELVYTLKIKNIGETPVEDIVAEFPVPDGTEYVGYETEDEGVEVNLEDREEKLEFEDYELTEEDNPEDFIKKIKIVNIKISKLEEYIEKNINITFKVKKVNRDSMQLNENGEYEYYYEEKFPESYINLYALVTAKDLSKELEVKSRTITVKEAIYKLEQKMDSIKQDVYQVGNELNFKIKVENLSNTVKKNIKIVQILPKELQYVKSSIEEYYIPNKDTMRLEKNEKEFGSFDENTNAIIWELDELNKKLYNIESDDVYENFIYLNYTVKINDITDGSTKKLINLEAILQDEGEEEYRSNVSSVNIGKPMLTITQISNNNNTYINPGEVIKYTFLIENKGGAKATNIQLTDNVPTGMIAEKVRYIDAVGNVIENRAVNGKVLITKYELNPGEELQADVELKVSNTNTTAETTINNYGKLSSDNADEINSNSIVHIIKGTDVNITKRTDENNYQTTEYSTDNSNIVQSYKIEGTAWEDTNKNGMRDTNEKLLSGTAVKLINNENGMIIRDTQTDTNGKYTFAGISNGTYLVIFEYDTSKYVVTSYKKDGVANNVDSDAIYTTIEQNGTITYGAITDVITVSNSSISGIDLGLMLSEIFDLKIDKTITKLTVQTSKSTTTDDYKNTKLAKAEIAAKNVSGSIVYVEYEIKVTNIGDISGYAKKIVDYVPKGMKFNSSLDANANWYTGSDGNLYSSAFENVELKKGESRTLNLVLTKTMTAENTGISNNQAEIYEDYNIYGVTDTNSKPGNKLQKENDLSSADAVILIKTGETFIYISVIITSLLLGGILGFVIANKIQIKRRRVGV